MSRAIVQHLVSRLNELGQITDEPGKLTRTFLSPAMARANARVGEWMRAAGLVVREDAVGNLIGRLEGPAPGAKTLLLGSHLDTVRDAGRFDGALGVLLPIAVIEELKRRGIRLPFAVEVLGFSEEEGVRFSSAYLGSKGFTGQLRARDLAGRDAEGVSVRDALAAWIRARSPRGSGPEPQAAPVPETELAQDTLPGRRKRTGLLGYVEVHIEQGPVLETEKLAVGVVSAIAGQTRGRMTFRGKAGHAGTTPMHLRRDALAGAAEFIQVTESAARSRPPLVATVGRIAVSPGAANVIAGEAIVSLDIRHPRDIARLRALAHLRRAAEQIARRRGLQVTWEPTQDNGAVVCSTDLSACLQASVQRVHGPSAKLVSGAGHDAVILSSITPVAMLFVRCRGGLSHHPDEYASPADIAVAFQVLVDFVAHFGEMRGRRAASNSLAPRRKTG